MPVPFDEDSKEQNVWFLDHDYLENMYGMFKKVNGKRIFTYTFSLLNKNAITIFFLKNSFIKLVRRLWDGTTLDLNYSRMT